MLRDQKKSITLIEKDLARCRTLMEKFPYINVSYGEGEQNEILEEEKIADQDVVLSLTDSDEENLVTSLYAWSRNVPSVLTRIEKPGQLGLLHKINLDITLSPPEISVNILIRFIHNCSAKADTTSVDNYCTLGDNRADVFQYTVSDSFAHPDVPIKDPAFRLKKNILITARIRGDKLTVPDRHTSFTKGDKVFIVSDRKNRIGDLNDIFI